MIGWELVRELLSLLYGTRLRIYEWLRKETFEMSLDETWMACKRRSRSSSGIREVRK